MPVEAPQARKSAPAAAPETYYGERNTGIRLVSTGKIDEEAEAARKSLIRSMGKKPKNSVTDRWQPKEEPSQESKLEVGGQKIKSSHSEYEKRRMSRIEARKAELEKLAEEQKKAEQERMERMERRRSKRNSRTSVTDLANKIESVKLPSQKEEISSVPIARQSAPVGSMQNGIENGAAPRLSHR